VIHIWKILIHLFDLEKPIDTQKRERRGMSLPCHFVSHQTVDRGDAGFKLRHHLSIFGD
jgi:hypothetical protein